jgi:hypothetical protein
MDIDSVGRRLYWNERNGNTNNLWRAKLDGGDPEIFIKGLPLTARFKIDDCRGQLLYLDWRGIVPELKSIKTRGKPHAPSTVAALPGGNPASMTLDPRNKRVYFLSTETAGNTMEATIHSIGYAGKTWTEEARLSLKPGGIAGLAYHHRQRTLAWGRNSGGKNRVIEGIALDGEGKVFTLRGPNQSGQPGAHYPAELERSPAWFSQRIYWADLNNNFVASVNLDRSDFRTHAVVPDVNDTVHPAGLDFLQKPRKPILHWKGR